MSAAASRHAILVRAFLFALIGLCPWSGFTSDVAKGASSIQLNSECPPGFEQVSSRCYLRNLYQLYDSLQDAGVGGLKTGLPTIRDGFTPRQIDLGRYLFFDPALSGDGSLSCGSCHHPEFGFSDGRDRSIGVTGEKVKRSAPSL